MHQDKNKYHLLIVEDNPGDLLLVTDYLEEIILAPEISHAATFQEAREILKNTQPDIVLLDLSLPDKSGENLVAAMMEIVRDIPVMILTGYQDMDFAARSLTYGISDYLLKDQLNATILHKTILYSLQRHKYLGQIRDSEKRYADLFHFSPLPMWVFDRESLSFLDINEAACIHYGYSHEEFLGMKLSDIRPVEDVPKLNAFIQENNDYNDHSGVFRHKKKNGEIIYVELRSRVLKMESPNIRIAMANDITKQRQAQEQLLNITFQVENKERSRIASNLHDGLQQTLLASHMHFENFKKLSEKIPEQPKLKFEEGLQMLTESINEARRLAHELLPPDLEHLGYSRAIQNILLKYNGEDSPLNFTYFDNLTEIHLPANIELILFRITQELINNVIKHSGADEASIEVELDNSDISVMVMDNGNGFDYQQLKDQPSFGLKSIASRISTLSGQFSVKSMLGKGTKITLSIPITSQFS